LLIITLEEGYLTAYVFTDFVGSVWYPANYSQSRWSPVWFFICGEIWKRKFAEIICILRRLRDWNL